MTMLLMAGQLREDTLIPCRSLFLNELNEAQRFQLGMNRHQPLGRCRLELLIGA